MTAKPTWMNFRLPPLICEQLPASLPSSMPDTGVAFYALTGEPAIDPDGKFNAAGCKGHVQYIVDVLERTDARMKLFRPGTSEEHYRHCLIFFGDHWPRGKQKLFAKDARKQLTWISRMPIAEQTTVIPATKVAHCLENWIESAANQKEIMTALGMLATPQSTDDPISATIFAHCTTMAEQNHVGAQQVYEYLRALKIV